MIKFKKIIHLNPSLFSGILLLFQSLIYTTSGQTGYRLIPLSGADGVFETIKTDQDTTYRSTGTPGNYQPYMYFRTNIAVNNKTVYIEVNYVDEGYGTMGINYNSTTELYQIAEVRYSNYFLNKGGTRKAVFQLDKADFKDGQNMNADLRLYISDLSIQMQIRSVILYFEPTPFFLSFEEDFVIPYSGRKYTGENKVDATTLSGKAVTGYQGWFRTLGDASGQGWVHYANQDFSDLQVEYWPDMLEYSYEEEYPVPGWTMPDGGQASLFSSANKKTVLRHFQWMQAYGIEVAALQRFLVATSPSHPKESFRLPAYVREAANRTGRSYFIMYDLSGYSSDYIAPDIEADWKYLVDSMKITEDDRYLHHNGKPVVAIFGFYADRFSASIGNKILDVFQQEGKYNAFTIGSGETLWRNETASGWTDVFHRMDAWIPWNVGNISGNHANTGTWNADKSDLEANGVMFMPLVFPGFAWDNLMNKAPGTTVISRLKGDFLWQQLLDIKDLNNDAMYIAMFDEIDEGTAIFKVSNEIPVNHYFLTPEDLPSDFYLLMTGYGAKMMNGQAEVPGEMPDFASQSQPSIPEVLTPAHEQTVRNPVIMSWSDATHTSGITGYELLLDDQPVFPTGTEFFETLAEGQHTIQVRASNGLGNKGGYSEKTIFTVSNSVTGLVQHPNYPDAGFRLYQNLPNPFKDKTAIEYIVPHVSYVDISVYNLQGQLVNVLTKDNYETGHYRIEWNGTDFGGNLLDNGIYICRMVADRFAFSRKIWLVR